MRRPAVVLGLAWLAASLNAFAYTPYYSDSFSTINTSYWNVNGTVATQPPSGGIVATSVNGGSVISKVAVPDGTSDYEVKANIHNSVWNGGNYVLFLRATPIAIAPQDLYFGNSFYGVELLNPSFGSNPCSGYLQIIKVVNGNVTALTGKNVGCHDGMELRAYVYGSLIKVFIDGAWQLTATDSTLTTGKPGVGGWSMPQYSAITNVELRPIETVAPSAIDLSTVSLSNFPNRIEAQWKGVVDNAGGIGFREYSISRNGVWFTSITKPSFTDATVSADTTYTYTVYACDDYQNCSAGQTFTAVTPPTGAIDSRRVGVRPDGAYWGAAGENIDTRSGNVSFSLPLVKAVGRNNGPATTFGLHYNSQMWRQDGGGDWRLGEDTGYGFGWKILAGSILPVYSDIFTTHHYIYIDSTGAEYHLNFLSNGVWISREPGVYVAYDAGQRRLYFPDGSFWAMGAESAGVEEDAGALYPTLMQDSNGNQIAVAYDPGSLAPAGNSSGRIVTIDDLRGHQSTCDNHTNFGSADYPAMATYRFVWQQGERKLLNVFGCTGTGEDYVFGYSANSFTLTSPFTPYRTFGAAKTLQSLTDGLGRTHQFQYGTGNTAELSQITFPYGGTLAWSYGTGTYTGGRLQREAATRTVTYSTLGTPKTATLTNDGNPGLFVHSWMKVTDSAGQKQWDFENTDALTRGFTKVYYERPGEGQRDLLRKQLGYGVDGVGRLVLTTVTSQYDPGQSYAWSMTTSGGVDAWGNQLGLEVRNGASQVLRTYTNTYVTDSAYTSRHINNLLASSQVTNGTKTITLATNTWDGYGQTGVCNAAGQPSFTPSLQGLTGGFLWTSQGITTQRGNLTRSVRPDGWACISYNQVGEVIATQASTGAGSTSNYTTTTNYGAPESLSVNGLSSTLSWNSWLGSTGQTGPNGDSVSMTYDGFARPQTYMTSAGATVTLSYSGNTATETINGRWRTRTLDGFGRVVKLEAGDGTGTKSVVDTEYDACACSPLGKVKRVSQPYAPGGTVYWTTYQYDAMGRTLSVTAADEASATQYLYQGNTVTTTDAAGKWKKLTMDEFGNVTQVNEPDPVTIGQEYVTSYQYDLLNHLTKVQMPRPSGGGSYTQERTWVYSDTDQRLQSQTLPETGTTYFGYNSNGLLFSKRDANGVRKEFSYDSKQRVTAVRYYRNSDGYEFTDRRVDYYWDTNPFDGAYTQYASGRLAAVQYKLSSSPVATVQEMFSYKEDGRLLKKRMRYIRGSATRDLEASYTFEPTEGRPATLTYPDGSTVLTYGYNFLGQMTGLNQGGTVLATAGYGPAGELLSFNDERRDYNQMLQMTRLYTTDRFTEINYGYPGAGSNSGQIASQTMAGTGGAVYQNERWGTFSYNFAVPNGSYRVRLKFAELYFNAANQRKFHVEVNGTRVLSAFDVFAAAGGQNQSVDREFPVTVANGQVQLAFMPVVDNAKVNAIEIVGAPGSGFTPIRVIAGGGAVTDARGVVWSADTGYSGGYTYSTGSTINGEVVNYSYDALGRIASAEIGGSAGWGFAYAFDGWGNRTEQRQTKAGLSSTILSYSAASNRISSAGYGYDSNGNMTQINAPASMTLTYDQENRLVTTSAGESYGYAPDNKRVWKSAGGSEWLYFWLGDRMLTRYSVAAGTYALTAERVEKYFGGRVLGTQPDRLASDVAGGKRYHPYGEEVAPSGNEAWKFGTYWREGNGLDYADQRWYASGVGRFLTADPYSASGGVESPGSWNRYGYVEGDPGNFTDASGLYMSAAAPPTSPPAPPPPAPVDLSNMCLALAQSTYQSSQNSFSGEWFRHNWGSAGYYSWQSACLNLRNSTPGGGREGNGVGETTKRPTFMNIVKKCAGEAFGVETALASALVALGNNLIETSGLSLRNIYHRVGV